MWSKEQAGRAANQNDIIFAGKPGHGAQTKMQAAGAD